MLVAFVVAGAFVLLMTVWTYRDKGPGSGFTGHTSGFRIKLWLLSGLGLLHLVAGIVGLLRIC
jgi:hypothetical protein